MTHDLLLGRLHEAGFASADADSRVALLERAVQGFVRRGGRMPHWAWFVPGRIEIFGKHTDYAGGRSLVAAVPRGFAVAAGPRADGVVSVTDVRWRDEIVVDPHDQERRFKGWSNYVAVVARRLARNFPGAPLGADVAVASDLPRAAGLSSSSALVVGVSAALIRRGGLVDRPEWAAAIPSHEDLAGYLGAVENGLGFGPLADASGVGTHGGSEDHTAILLSRSGVVRAFAYVPVRPVAEAPMPPAWRFIVLSSGIRADKAGSVRGRYNRASLATQALAAVWRAGTGGAGEVLARILEPAGALDELRRLIERVPHADFSPAELAGRLDHFVAEDARVPRAVEAFQAGDRAALGELATASQRDADRLLDNQTVETRELAVLARGCGAFAASSFGAGFGGSLWALAPEADAEDVAQRWRAAYRQAYPATGEVECFITRPAPGVTDLSPVG